MGCIEVDRFFTLTMVEVGIKSIKNSFHSFTQKSNSLLNRVKASLSFLFLDKCSYP